MGISQALYVIDVMSNFSVGIVFAGIVLCVVLFCKAWWYAENEYNMKDEERQTKKKSLKGFASKVLIYFMAGIFTMVLIPSKDTMRNILIIETVMREETIEGAKEVYEWVKEEIKTWNEEE